MAIRGTIHTGLQVSDLERSIDFYVRHFGLSVRQRRLVEDEYIGIITGYPGVVIYQAFLDVPESSHWIELLEYRNIPRAAIDPATGNVGTAHFCFRVDNLASMYQRLVEERC